MAEDKNNTECPSCTKWELGFIVCSICSLIMFILCIVLWVKRNTIHETIYTKARDYINKNLEKGSEKRSQKRSGQGKGGEQQSEVSGGSIFY